MIQLKVFKTKGDPTSSIFIDLYDTEPIKLTLSIEDITTADASSVFSRTFRVPATRNNNEFFKNAFEIDGIDYDVTVKQKAEILVDGAEFKSGHVRLQKIFVNGDQDKIDYELLFLGETRDFSSVIADKTMCEIVMTDFAWEDLPVEYTNADDFIGPYNYAEITQSWNAFPESASLTAGTADGDLLFPLIDHGNTYDDAGNPLQGTISVDGPNRFTQQSNSLALTRLKPMIRAKRVWDQIFQDAGYTYKSDFLDSDRFHQMYISAFGNNESIGMEVDQITTTIFASANPTTNQNGVDDFVYNPQVFSNVGGYFSVGTLNNGSNFTCPADASVGGNYYIMSASAEVDAQVENSDYTYSPSASAVQLVVVDSPGGNIQQVLATGNYTFNNNTTSLTWDSRNGGYQPVAGDIIQLFINTSSPFVDYDNVQNTYWDCTAAPGDYYSPLDLDCEYQQIDYIKDVLTMFRLVMQPDEKRPNNFIIEPWQNFIGSGKTRDWSHKLVEDKDVQLEPLFNTQSQTIEFTMEEDEDLINKFHQDNNKNAYGWLRFNSNNELLKGKRDIKVTGISPTPLDQINHGTNAPHSYPEWVIPTIIEVTGENFQRLPIKSNTRFLFYNGKQTIEIAQDDWYLNNDGGTAEEQTVWPLVSSYEHWPVQSDSVNLNFSNDTRYYLNPPLTGGYYEQGSTLYDEYWSRYINSLYNKFSRRLTAYFILDNTDLQGFQFSDIIFVNGKYFRPEKIMDVQIGSKTAAKVQLITYKDQRPVWLEEPLDGFSAITYNNNCIGASGSIQITTNGTPDFTWTLVESGETGTYNATAGQAPYTFVIDAPVGTDTLELTDSVGRFATIQVQVPASTATEVTGTSVDVDPTICAQDEGQCNGTITVTPSGGTGPYTISWSDGGATNFDRTNLCEGSYTYVITDDNECQSDPIQVELECNDGSTNYLVEICGGGDVITVSYSGTLEEDDVVSLNEIAGCWLVLGVSVATPSASVDSIYVDCPTCEADQPSYVSWKVESCDTPLDFQYVPNNSGATLSPGLVIELVGTAADGCYEVIEESTTSPTYLVTNIYQDCATCNSNGSYTYFVEDCDGNFGHYATSTNPNISVGTIMKYIQDGTTVEVCVSVGQQVQIQNDGVLVDGTTYSSCEDCEGIQVIQVCHDIDTFNSTSANGTYVFNGTTFTWNLEPDSIIAICAEAGSIVTLTGTPNIFQTNNDCESPRACSIPMVTCDTLRFTNDSQDPQVSYTYTNCEGMLLTGTLNPGAAIEDCVRRFPQPFIDAGGTITTLAPCL